jgi:hypothetical protein
MKKDEKKYIDYVIQRAPVNHRLTPFKLYNPATGMMDLAAFTPSGVVVVRREYCKIND